MKTALPLPLRVGRHSFRLWLFATISTIAGIGGGAIPARGQLVSAPAQDGEEATSSVRSTNVSTPIARSVYESSSTAVVGIACERGARETFFGTGVLIDPAGIVLTSTTVAPRDARGLRVFLRGGRVAEARMLLVDESNELVLLRLRRASELGKDSMGELPYLHLGESRVVEVGDPVFTLGNAFQSIENDDQVVLAAGIVSGFVRLSKTRSESQYAGLAIETTAALNNGMDGGPLIDANGELVGLLCLNYSRSRWLGTAVPIDVLKPLISRHRPWFDDRRYVASAHEESGAPAARLGVELEEVGGKKVSVARVSARGPAARAGLRTGDRLVRIGDVDITTMGDFRGVLTTLRPASESGVTVERDGELVELRLRPGGRL